ncbi:MAG TPA: SH3 domain-containing protein, partial [Anaeromyxobacter sp.]|nr:SH3 domain-containing protein [Anaeromyxobacter sp.]
AGPHECRRGADAKSLPAPRGAGRRPEPVVLEAPNAWLHPLGLQAALEYARDLFLAGARDELLAMLGAYRSGLEEPRPTGTGAWDGVPAAEWAGAQVEVATMVHRLHAHLDCFGHPAGFTPLLSLPGSIKLYDDETRRALRMILLARWVSDVELDARESAAVMAEAIAVAQDDSRAAAEQVAAGQEKIPEIRSLIDSVDRELTGLGNRLVAVRNALLAKAESDERTKAAIKFSAKMAGALCQIIPVGQPALGTVGSLAATAADLVGGDPDAAPDTISRMAQVLKDASDAAERASAAGAEAAKDGEGAADRGKDGEKRGAGEDAEKGEQEPSAWGTVGKGLAPALSHVAEAVKALQAPKHEIEAALARLEAGDRAWNEVTRDIRELNEKKASLFGALTDAIQSVGEGFSRMSSNAGTIVRLRQQRAKTVGKLDPEAVYVVRQLGQRARLTLQRYLYLMVKAYESTLLRHPVVDWQLTNVTEKVGALLGEGSKFDAASLNAHAEALEVLFQQNLSALRSQLLNDFDFGEDTMSLQLGLTRGQTPDVIERLNTVGRAVVSPEAYGLLLPDRQLARLSGVKLSRLAFDPEGPPLPENANVAVSLVPAGTGTMRRGEGLHALASEAPVRWRWTCVAAGDPKPARPSATAEDVLDFILGKGGERIRRRISMPPAWSDLTVSVLFAPPLPEERRPRIDHLYFELEIDSSPAPEQQRVLSVQPKGAPTGAVTSCSADLGHRTDGVGRVVRIYAKGASVVLSVPGEDAGSVFQRWDVIPEPVDPQALRSSSLELRLDDHAWAVSSWSAATEGRGHTTDLSSIVDTAAIRAALREAPSEELEQALGVLQRTPKPPRAAPRPRSIRSAPAAAAPVLGILPPDGVPDVLEEDRTGWRLVNYQGVVGWVRTLDPR